MSYTTKPEGYADLGALPHGRYRRVRRRRRPRAIVARRPQGYYFKGPEPGISTRYLIGDVDDQLGFSLRPPKWLRKDVKKAGKFIAKHKTAFLIGAAALTAGVLAPGAAVAVGRGALSAGRLVGRGATGLFNFSKRLLPHGGGGTGGTIPSDQPDSGGQPDGGPSGGSSPLPPAPSMPPLQMPGGGGGQPDTGAPSTGGDTPTSQAVPASDTEAQVATPKPGLNPMVVFGGLALLGIATAARGRRTR